MLKGIIIDNKEYNWDEYLQTDKSMFIYPIKLLISNLNTNYIKSPYSPSNISLCMKKNYLESINDFYITEQSAYNFIRGSLIHKLLEGIIKKDSTFTAEQNVEYFIKDLNYNLKGQIDLYKNDILYDYKTTSDENIKYILKNGLKESYIWQTNIYKYLLKKVHNIDINKIFIIFITMKNTYTTGGKIIIKDKYGKEIIEKLPSVPIYQDYIIENYILKRLNFLKDNSEPCSEPDTIICKSCYFYNLCYKK